MTDQTTTTANSNRQEPTLLDQARGAFSNAGDSIRDAYDGVVDAAKGHPKTAAAIAAGTAAAVAGAAFGVSKLRQKDSAAK